MWRIVLLLAIVLGVGPTGSSYQGKEKGIKPGGQESGAVIQECCGGVPPPCPPYCGEEGGD